jgi:PASTA domain-containing protein
VGEGGLIAMKLLVVLPLVASVAVVFFAARVADSLAFDWHGLLDRGPVAPSLVNRPITEANEVADNAGLTVVVSRVDASAKQPRDVVVAQSPGPGAHLRPGEPIRLTVSPGLLAPNVIGRTVDQARADLLQAGWSAAAEVETRGVAAGSPNLVLDQRPRADELVSDRAPVTLIVPLVSLTVGRPTSTSAGPAAAEAVDGKRETVAWPTGDAPCWVEVNLAGPSRVGAVNLVAATARDTPATIEVWAWDAGGRFLPLYLFTTNVTDGATLHGQLPAPAENVVKLRIATTATESPIGWREIEAIAP